jgi:hypothetical protein|mmetsp:Transcript_71242/g.112844  ORF Transcript_71242/g.112844 Transcript_71242/m.112844 type:complete len:275 (+) Transcript_71242:56-880(+)
MFAEKLQKTKMCRFHPLGKCTKGTDCPFAHQRLELKTQPDLRCTKLCKTLLQTGLCDDRKNCPFAHNKEELRVTDAFQKTKLCRNLEFGKCSRGIKCHFAHSPEELKAPVGSPTLKMPPGLGWEGFFGDDNDDATTYVSGEYSSSRDSGSDGDAASQHNRTMDATSEPAYVKIGSDATTFSNPLGVNTSDSFRKRGLGDYTYLCGTDLDYLDSLSRWQGDWGIGKMTSMQSYPDAFVGIDVNGTNAWEWDSFEDNGANDKKAMLQAMGAMHLVD